VGDWPREHLDDSLESMESSRAPDPGHDCIAAPPRVDWRFATLCAALLALIFAFQNWITRDGLGFERSVAQQLTIYVVWLVLLPFVLRSARKRPLVERPTRRWLFMQFWIGSGYSLIHAVMTGLLRWLLGIAFYRELADILVSNITGNWGRNLITYGLVVAAYQSMVYHRAVRERDHRAARLELDLARAHLETLGGRIRPHFLFNTLNTIASMVRADPSKAEAMIGQLSDLLRASLRSDPERKVRLDEELTLVTQYLEIERTRFADRLTVSVLASDGAHGALVPHLILQPLVENAVRHGIAPREGPGSIVVRAGRHDGYLAVEIEDDGVGMGNAPPAREGGGVGLSTVRSRLGYLYGSDHRFEVVPVIPAGTLVRLEIPYEVETSA
jgi:two-component system, LytTR family, sensor kinase